MIEEVIRKCFGESWNRGIYLYTNETPSSFKALIELVDDNVENYEEVITPAVFPQSVILSKLSKRVKIIDISKIQCANLEEIVEKIKSSKDVFSFLEKVVSHYSKIHSILNEFQLENFDDVEEYKIRKFKDGFNEVIADFNNLIIDSFYCAKEANFEIINGHLIEYVNTKLNDDARRLIYLSNIFDSSLPYFIMFKQLDKLKESIELIRKKGDVILVTKDKGIDFTVIWDKILPYKFKVSDTSKVNFDPYCMSTFYFVESI